MRRTLLVAAAFVAALLTGSATASMPGRAGVQAHASRYGAVLFDGRGFVLYGFTADSGGKSACKGACAKAWPPFLTTSAPRALKGTAAAKLGTIKRADGTTQVTYAGHPLYYYVGDTKPAQILCQNVNEFGGLWLVVGSKGALVK
jgi:predicted lipoprotein with Yx(FWY)xxD motif